MSSCLLKALGKAFVFRMLKDSVKEECYWCPRDSKDRSKYIREKYFFNDGQGKDAYELSLSSHSFGRSMIDNGCDSGADI